MEVKSYFPIFVHFLEFWNGSLKYKMYRGLKIFICYFQLFSYIFAFILFHEYTVLIVYIIVITDV